MPLEDYKRKRDFENTPEPAVKDFISADKDSHSKLSEYSKSNENSENIEYEHSKSKDNSESNGKLSFVVHKHFASHLHFDLRLELDGVLKSWAIPKGPTINPKEKKLAIMVEDHPLEYKDFEGVIPDGNYGAGQVYIWDKGSYHALGALNKLESTKILREGLENGHLTFILNGKILKGEFALVRLKKASPKDWLLIKKNDEFAKNIDVTKIKAPNEV